MHGVGEVNGWWFGKLGAADGWFPSAYMHGGEAAQKKLIAKSKTKPGAGSGDGSDSCGGQGGGGGSGNPKTNLDAFEGVLKAWRPKR